MFFVKNLSVVIISAIGIFATSLPVVAQGTSANEQGSSIVFQKPPTGSGLTQMRMKSEVLSLIPGAEGRALLSAANLTVSQATTPENFYHLVLDGQRVSLPVSIADELAEIGLPIVIDVIAVDVGVSLDKPWSLMDVRRKSLHAENIAVKDFVLHWGDIQITGDGAFSVDAAGLVTGMMLLQVSAWQNLLDMASINDEQLAAIGQIMSAMAVSDGSIPLTVTVEDSSVIIGSITVATIPPLLLP